MMAAAAPRLRLLGALRAQSFRGPLWCRGALAVRGVASGGGQPLSPPFPPPPPPSTPSPTPPNSGGAPPALLNPQILGENPQNLGETPQNPGAEIWGGVAEPRLEELGLGGFTPVGLVQNLLQSLHLDLGLPWWGAIAAGTVGVRLLLLPLVLRGQREAARLAQHLPHLQRLNQRLAEARRGRDQHQVARAYTELVSYQRKHDVNPLRGFLVPLVQTPVFVSFFLALQGLAAAPVPGFSGGGLGWVLDLGSPDPFYVLPLLVTASTWMVLELGAETGVATPGGGATRQLLRLLPLLFLPFILHFPAAVFTYWLTSNSFSLLQTGLLRVPALRARLGVAPPLATPTPVGVVSGPAHKEKGSFLQRLKKEWQEAQVTHQAEQRQQRLRDQLSLAGKGPLRPTFPQNPLGGDWKEKPPKPPQKRPWRDSLG